jgi:hypothetical protein
MGLKVKSKEVKIKKSEESEEEIWVHDVDRVNARYTI